MAKSLSLLFAFVAIALVVLSINVLSKGDKKGVSGDVVSDECVKWFDVPISTDCVQWCQSKNYESSCIVCPKFQSGLIGNLFCEDSNSMACFNMQGYGQGCSGAPIDWHHCIGYVSQKCACDTCVSTCVDSDNTNADNAQNGFPSLFVRSTTSVGGNTYTDLCSDAYTIEEISCSSSGDIEQYKKWCPAGCSEGACLRGATCVDTDSDAQNPQGNIYVKGFTKVLGSPASWTWNEDFCGESSILQEIYCESPNSIDSSGRTVSCPNGCENGACKQWPDVARDSDADATNPVATSKSYFVKGVCEGKIKGGGNGTDECRSENQLREFYLDATDPQACLSLFVSCAPGSVCSDGACKQQAQPICTDSDGGKITSIKGSCSLVWADGSGGGGGGTADSCVDANHVRECYCDASIKSEVIACGTGSVCVGGACKVQVCAPGTKQCEGSNLKTCESDGLGWDVKACQNGCENGACKQYGCVPGTKRCESGYLKTCKASGTGWNVQACQYGCDSEALTCKSAPTQVCTPNTRQCEGNNAKTCKSDGSGWIVAACQYGCGNGYCKPRQICTPGAKRCEGPYLKTCKASGTGWGSTLCWWGCNPATLACKSIFGR